MIATCLKITNLWFFDKIFSCLVNLRSYNFLIILFVHWHNLTLNNKSALIVSLDLFFNGFGTFCTSTNCAKEEEENFVETVKMRFKPVLMMSSLRVKLRMRTDKLQKDKKVRLHRSCPHQTGGWCCSWTPWCRRAVFVDEQTRVELWIKHVLEVYDQ